MLRTPEAPKTVEPHIGNGEASGGIPSKGWQHPLVLRGVMFVLLFGLWLALSGHLELEFLVLGLLAAALVVGMTGHLVQPSFAEHYEPLPSSFAWLGRTILRLAGYAPWLAWEIIVANLLVTYRILHPRLPISPRLLRFHTSLRGELPHLLLAQSITLTPGTITVDLDHGELVIHALFDSHDQSLAEGAMEQRIAAVFGEQLSHPPVVRVITDVNELRQ